MTINIISFFEGISFNNKYEKSKVILSHINDNNILSDTHREPITYNESRYDNHPKWQAVKR